MTGPYLYTRAPEGSAYLATSPIDGHVLTGGETLQYEPVCMLLVQTSPPLVRTKDGRGAQAQEGFVEDEGGDEGSVARSICEKAS